MEPNQKVGRLTLLEPTKIGTTRYWRVACDCGTVKSVRDSNLRQRLTQSCGCLRQQIKNSVMGSTFRSLGRSL